MNKKEHDESEPDSAEILEDAQHQHEPGARSKRVQIGVMGEGKHSVLEGNNKNSL